MLLFTQEEIQLVTWMIIQTGECESFLLRQNKISFSVIQ